MEFEILARTFDELERISSRIALTNALVDLFKQTPKEEIRKVVYLIQGRLWPDWKGLPELGVAEKLLIKALSMATNTREEEVEKLFKEAGDLGKVAEQLKKTKAQQPRGLIQFIGGSEKSKLSVSRVYESFSKIATAEGEGSRDLKLRILSALIKEAEPIEAKFIVRFVEGRLRINIGDATIMDALAIAYGGTKASRQLIERAYNLRADLGDIAEQLAMKGLDFLTKITPTFGIPIRPMLAERHRDPKEMIEKVGGKAYVEYKYDGERAQIHYSRSNVLIFSRRLENITHQYPDVIDSIRDAISAEEAIVEGEIVPFDPETGEMRPFQILMTRKRKHDIHRAMKEVPVKVFLFDVLYLDGRDLTNEILPKRREALEKIIKPNEGVEIAKYIVASNSDELERFFLEAISNGAEGVMVKSISEKSIYQAGNRGWLWIKYKRDYKSEMTDSVDLVVVGAFYGKGKRAGKLSTLLLAGYDEEEDVFRTVCKVGTGFTDEELDRMTSELKSLQIDHRDPRVISDIEPDVWVKPVKVVEVIGAELTLSPLHSCARDILSPGTGISIRFPRFISWRTDKGPEDATTCKELIEMYNMQLKKIEEPAEVQETQQ
ncbi:MAG: ATP-dependent DNA ligase [Fervidicoccaceae archaeon]